MQAYRQGVKKSNLTWIT